MSALTKSTNFPAQLAKEAVSSWAKTYVEKAKAAGIMDGTAPQGFVTREQAAKMIITATEK